MTAGGSAGHEIGSHTVSHPDLTIVDRKRLEDEVGGSKRDLEAITGRPVVTFCYPAGEYDREVIAAVERAGYRMALTTDRGGSIATDEPFRIPRYRIKEKTRIRSVLRQCGFE